jgi:hypothetical protein
LFAGGVGLPLDNIFVKGQSPRNRILQKEHSMATKKPSHSKSKSTAQERSEKRRKVKLGVASEAARKAPIRVATGDDDDINDLEVQR